MVDGARRERTLQGRRHIFPIALKTAASADAAGAVPVSTISTQTVAITLSTRHQYKT
jgi:hypothetical protein